MVVRSIGFSMRSMAARIVSSRSGWAWVIRAKCMTVPLGMLVVVGCTIAPEYGELPLEPLLEDAGGGSLRFSATTRELAELRVQLSGLEPQTAYILCLNASESGSQTSTLLGHLEVPGWPLGAFHASAPGRKEGFWDFAQIETDAAGSYDDTFFLPLPPLRYRVKFLVKLRQRDVTRSILGSNAMLLTVHASWITFPVAGTLAAVWLLGLAIGLRFRRFRPEVHPEGAPAPAEQNEPEQHAPITSAGSQEPCAEPPPSLIDRARTSGVLQHHPNYSWVEIHGRRKSFRPRQALVFKILCEQDPNGYGLTQEEIVKPWEEVFQATRANPVRIRDIFRTLQDEPGDFIVRVPGPASMYRLKLDASALCTEDTEQVESEQHEADLTQRNSSHDLSE